MKTLMIIALMSTMTIAVNGGSIVNLYNSDLQNTELRDDFDTIYTQDNTLVASTAMGIWAMEHIWFEAMKGESILLQTNVIEDRNLLHVKVELTDLKGGTIEVKNERGTVVWSANIQEDEPSMEFYLDMKRFPKGSYYVEASQLSQVTSPKFQVK